MLCDRPNALADWRRATRLAAKSAPAVLLRICVQRTPYFPWSPPTCGWRIEGYAAWRPERTAAVRVSIEVIKRSRSGGGCASALPWRRGRASAMNPIGIAIVSELAELPRQVGLLLIACM